MAIAYVNNIPQAADLLSQSQASLLTNTQGVSTFLNIDHIDFASASAGMHKWIELPTAGTPSVVAGKMDLYPKLNNAGNFATGRNELFIQPAGQVSGLLGAAIPATAVNPSTNGWTYLPSGMILQWGSFTTSAADYTSNTFSFPQPFPTAAVSLQITVKPTETFRDWGVGIITSASQFQVATLGMAGSSPSFQASTFYFTAIGY